MNRWAKNKNGFTIVELLVVIAIIGVLVAITTAAYGGIRHRAEQTKIKQDTASIVKAIVVARDIESKTLDQIIGNPHGVGGPLVPCGNKPSGTDFATLARSDPCWTVYLNALNRISAISGLNVRDMIDPWGRPYRIAGLENARCTNDEVAAWPRPFRGGQGAMGGTMTRVPRSSYHNCA